ncbi:MAG: LytS/YhcK type 5TM receptor domain-containing protein [Candidatus Omnitrophota bacterium]
MIFKPLFENLTLLLALCTAYSFTLRYYRKGTLTTQCFTGLIFGGVAFVVMMYPYVLAPGLIFDTRSVLLSTVGLFGGTISAAVAVLITASYRLWLGGPGMIMGVGVIVTSAAIGAIYHNKYRRSLENISPYDLYILGLIVHFFMIVWTLAVPWPLSLTVMKKIWLPVIVIYPIGNVILGLLLANQESLFHTEIRLKESEKRYRELVHNVNSIILRINPQGKITFINEYALQFFGYSEEEILGRDVLGSILPERESTGRNLKVILENILLHPIKYARSENENITKDGRRVWIVWSNRPIFDQKGNFVEIFCVGNDNTEQKRLEEQLIQSQKMESVGRLAGGIAHDFNNLLLIINGYSQLALQHLEPDSPIYKDIESILKAGERAAALTRQLLAFSRKQVIQAQIINLNTTIVELDKMLRRLIGENIELVTIPSPSLNPIKADPGQIEQIIMNMAVNARDAMPYGGKLVIETANIHLDESYTQNHAEVIPGDYVMLAISDSGCGMDKETMSKIFDPFFTTKDFGKGTGLGLSTVYGIVKQCEGHIWTYSELGQGTAFKIYFPSVIAPIVKEEYIKDSVENLQGSETILLVEDEDSVRNLLNNVLSQNGYRVLAASCGCDALSLFEENKESISLVITDVVMPGMSGRELSDRLAAFHSGVKILFLSGYTGENILLNDILEEGGAFIQKPIAIRDLLKKVKEILGT